MSNTLFHLVHIYIYFASTEQIQCLTVWTRWSNNCMMTNFVITFTDPRQQFLVMSNNSNNAYFAGIVVI